MQKGLYQLLIHLPESAHIQIGKRGRFRFPKGYYVYTGSAKKGLEGRVKRHLRKEKRRFWHIDYLLDHASVTAVFPLTNERKDECSLSSETLAMPGAEVIVPGFGSSDCKCPSHLVFFRRQKDVP
ncbi:MAG: GIY-YIG nuclease family protein [Candidatus Zixiibacteriota bacterium]|nr:MAG: GIY-YIG nuclease family protein [candidate division Zixibacteria bacterium]